MYHATSIFLPTDIGVGGNPADPDPLIGERLRARCFRLMDMDATFNCILATNSSATNNVRLELFSIDVSYTSQLPNDLNTLRFIDLSGIQWQGNIPEQEVRVLTNYYSVGWYYARITRADANTTLGFVPSTGMDRRAG